MLCSTHLKLSNQCTSCLLQHALSLSAIDITLRCIQAWCDLGTDCSDCGAFTYTLQALPGNSTLPERPRPVEMLVKRGIEARTNFETAWLPMHIGRQVLTADLSLDVSLNF